MSMKPFVLTISLLFFTLTTAWSQEAVFLDSLAEEESIIKDSIQSKKPTLKEKAEEFFFDDNNDYRFHSSQIFVPAVLVGIGAFGVENGWMCKQKENYKELMEKLCGGHKTEIDNYIQYAPWAAHLALPALGVKGRHTYREKLATTTTAFLMMTGIVRGLKMAVSERRPDSSATNSFPSGHTATAFCGAELVNIEYGGWYGVAAYASAFSVGFFRPYNSRHYLNDVIAGAAIGIFSARASHWLLPAERRLFKWDKKADSPVVVAVPFYNPEYNQFGASMAINF